MMCLIWEAFCSGNKQGPNFPKLELNHDVWFSAWNVQGKAWWGYGRCANSVIEKVLLEHKLLISDIIVITQRKWNYHFHALSMQEKNVYLSPKPLYAPWKTFLSACVYSFFKMLNNFENQLSCLWEGLLNFLEFTDHPITYWQQQKSVSCFQRALFWSFNQV